MVAVVIVVFARPRYRDSALLPWKQRTQGGTDLSAHEHAMPPPNEIPAPSVDRCNASWSVLEKIQRAEASGVLSDEPSDYVILGVLLARVASCVCPAGGRAMVADRARNQCIVISGEMPFVAPSMSSANCDQRGMPGHALMSHEPNGDVGAAKAVIVQSRAGTIAPVFISDGSDRLPANASWRCRGRMDPSAEMALGPSIESSNHTCSGNCAELPAPMRPMQMQSSSTRVPANISDGFLFLDPARKLEDCGKSNGVLVGKDRSMPSKTEMPR